MMLQRLFINTTRLFAATFIALQMVMAPALIATPASAAPIDVLDKCNRESRVCQGTNPNSLNGIIRSIINLLLTIIGIIAVIMIVVGGIRYTTSAGDAGQTKSARDTIIYAIVGLVIAIMSFAIVNFVLSKL